jgi:hypothetical protein
MSVTNNKEEKIIGGTVHCRSFIYENNAWDDFGGGKRGGDAGDCELNWQNPSLMYYQNNEFLVRKMDTIEDTIYDVEDWFIGMKYELNPNDPGIVYCGRKGKLLIYHDEKDSLEIKMIPQETGSAGALGINNRNDIYMAAFQGLKYNLENRFLKSSDNGNTWTDLCKNPITNANNETTELRLALNYKMIMDILFNPDNPDELWISGGGISVDGSDKSSKLNYPGKYRVMHSMDGGENWEDYSEGLTALPVAALEYQLGSNNRIFAGTEAGVFYREPGMQQWEPFTEGLPIGLISDLDYEPCSGYLYACIDSRGIWKTPLNFETENIEITGETNWDYTKRVTSDIIIEEGAKLNISGDIFIPEGKRIIVKPGGHLVLEGGKISNTCGGMWHGIEVLGNPVYGPDPLIQGFVELKNKATLENAEFGIYAHKMVFENEEWKYQPGFEGGMIQAENSKFVNNKNALCLMKAKDDNANYLHNCLFETNNNYIGEQNPESFISLEDVQGFEIYNCTFVNKSENDHLHTGISALNSRFYVYGKNISSAEPGRFENLDYGIYAIDYDQTRLPDIRNNLFINNYRGVYLKGYTESIIQANHFYLTQKAETKSYGVYLDESYDFFVEENLFVGDSSSSQTGIGIIVNHSGNKTNEIKLNHFSKLEYGINVQGINRNQEFPNRGLVLKCNAFEGCLFSQTILPENIYDIKPNDGMAMSQGFVSDSISDFTGNIFVNTENLQFNLYNEANYFDYSIPESSQYSFTPQELTNHTINISTENMYNAWDFENACIPTVFPQSNEEIQDVWEKYEHADSMALNYFKIYATKKDNGNTLLLNHKIQNCSKTKAAEIFAELYRISPWLSQSVLINIIENPLFTHSMVREIMVANQDASKYPIIMKTLRENRSNMPEYMLGQILESRKNKSSKQLLEAEMAWWEHESNKAYNLIAIYYTNYPDSLYPQNKTFIPPYGLEYENFNSMDYKNEFREDEMEKYGEQVLFPNLENTQQNMENYHNLLLSRPDEALKVFPNPAYNVITIDYILPPNEPGFIEIMNATGQKIILVETTDQGHTTIITEDWVSGIYFVSLCSKGNKIKNAKFIIAR